MSIEVRVPALGESVTEATVAGWTKKPGEAVAADEMLAELETDKVTVEVRAPAAGTLGEIVAGDGENVAVDALLATIEEDGTASGDDGDGDGDGDKGKAAEAPKGNARREPEPDGEGGGARVDVTVPTLGESVTEATVGSWNKAQGDSVGADEILCELETDKVSVEVPAPSAGRLLEILAGEGETVEPGGRLAVIETGGTGAASAGAPAADGKAEAPAREAETAEASPAARRMMEETGLSAGAVEGTGKGGRILKEDVQRAAEHGPKEAATAPAAEAGPKKAPAEAPKPEPAAAARAPVPAEDDAREERVRMSRLRQTVARRLKDAQNTAAMLTTYNEADMSAIMALRTEYKDQFEKKHGVKLGFMSFFVKACCHALFEVPEVNAEIDGTEVVYKRYVHMGVAVGTPQGLVVPVVRDAHAKSFAEIEKEVGALGARGRDGKLSMADLQGGTFTISNGGVYGSLMSSPILNPPQSGILGMHKIQERPMVLGGEIRARPMMYLALSYDHRVVDGKGAVTFLVRVKEALEDPRRLLMDL